MPKKLTVNFDRMASSAAKFRDTADEMTNLLIDANKSIDTLRSTKWMTPASNAYFEQYSDAWQAGFKEHILAVDHLARQLQSALNEYERLYDDAAQLARTLRG